MSQPRLSQIVRRIEDRTGFPLFIRRPQVRLTPAGEMIVKTAARALDDVRSGLFLAQDIAVGRRATLRLGYAPVAMLTDLPTALKSFRDDNPAVSLELTEAHTAKLWRGMDSGRFDLILTRETRKRRDILSRNLSHDRLVAVTSEGDPLAGRTPLRLSHLKSRDFVLFREQAAPLYHQRILDLCMEAGFEPRVSQFADGWSTILALVAAGFGVSLVSATLTRIPFPGCTFVELSSARDVAQFWMSWRAADEAPALQRLITTLTTNGAR